MAGKAIKLITFDITNTILRVKGSPAHQYVKAAQKHGVAISVDDIQKVYRNEFTKKKKLHPCYGVGQGFNTKQWWADFVAKVFTAAGSPANPKVLQNISDTLFDDFVEGNNWDVLPDSHRVLETLKTRDYKLAVVSNFDERLESTLKKYNLRDYFDLLVTPVTSRMEKPDPGIFLYTLDKLSLQAADAAHIGDDLVNDYFCAKKAGMRCYLLDPAEKYRDLDVREIDDRHCLKGLLDLEQIFPQ